MNYRTYGMSTTPKPFQALTQYIIVINISRRDVMVRKISWWRRQREPICSSNSSKTRIEQIEISILQIFLTSHRSTNNHLYFCSFYAVFTVTRTFMVLLRYVFNEFNILILPVYQVMAESFLQILDLILYLQKYYIYGINPYDP